MTSECSASALARARKVRNGFMHNIILYLHTDAGLMGIGPLVRNPISAIHDDMNTR